jgi:hypothetical protein
VYSLLHLPNTIFQLLLHFKFWIFPRPQFLSKIATMYPAVSFFALFRFPAFPRSQKAQNCLILIFNLMVDDIRLKFWPFALAVRGYRAFTLLALSPRSRETIPAERTSNRLTVAAGRTNPSL